MKSGEVVLRLRPLLGVKPPVPHKINDVACNDVLVTGKGMGLLLWYCSEMQVCVLFFK